MSLDAKVLGLALLGALAAALPAATFNVTTYGALGDGVTNDTAAIQAAINAAAGSGSQVLIPAAAASYLSDPLSLASNITFTVQTGAMLQMEPYGTYQGGSASPTYFLSGSNLSNVLINGGGTLDGQGAAWWAAFIANSAVVRPPALLRFANCSQVTVSGIRIQNSPMINQSFYNETNLLVSGETVFNPYASSSNNISPNTDGMDVTGTNIRIENCNISTGDDVIALGSTSAVTQNVTITGCTFGTGHGLSIGSHTSGGVNGLWVDHCTFTGTQYGLRFKSDRGNGGLSTNLHYSDLTMTGIVYYPVYLDSYYGVKPAPTGPTNDPGGPASLGTGTPQWTEISFTNINASCASGAKGPLYLWGLPEAKATDILFDNVTLNATGQNGLAYHAMGVSFTCSCRINGAAVSAANVASSDATLAYLACPFTPTPTTTGGPPLATATPSPAQPLATATRTQLSTATLSPTPTVTPSGTAMPPLATATATAKPSATGTPLLATETASVTRTGTPPPATVTPTPSATVTATPARVTASATPTTLVSWMPTPSPSVSASPVASWSPTAGASASPTVPPSATASATASLSPTEPPSLSATPSPVPSLSAAPTAVGGSLQILATAPWPDPDPRAIRVELSEPAAQVELTVWSVALRRLDRSTVAAAAAGWVPIPLPSAFLAQAGSGAYYYSVEARRGLAVTGRRLGIFYRSR